jgi:hypothetical protein
MVKNFDNEPDEPDPLAGLTDSERADVEKRRRWELDQIVAAERDDDFEDRWLRAKERKAKIAAAAKAIVAKQTQG